jgi:hypothetical protein
MTSYKLLGMIGLAWLLSACQSQHRFDVKNINQAWLHKPAGQPGYGRYQSISAENSVVLPADFYTELFGFMNQAERKIHHFSPGERRGMGDHSMILFTDNKGATAKYILLPTGIVDRENGLIYQPKAEQSTAWQNLQRRIIVFRQSAP